ncbi:polyketide synthase dehydratase domain-containing protein [Saccharothrix sp. S26]|uniref:polyketide synthase dehydratase domain-containing protein n=1 Tax=Saccharothrix sp. S26 TaxID=2907215 RepID=UPI001F1E3F50|nr:polyketide synthase dehydratase domain-containing protein [Saccharothrix sp. S26]MCE6998460.1 polyketide synthase dehydratase domain-containing protein [Saccharothrix sp. S26]
MFLPEPERYDGTAALWHVEVDLDHHDEIRHHLVNGQPTMPVASLVQIAAEAAASFAPDLAPVRYSDLSLPRLLRAPAERWPRRVDVTATRRGDDVDVRIDSPPVNAVPTVEYARLSVHLGVPEKPEMDGWPELGPEHAADHRFDGYLLPGDALDALLRSAGPQEALSSVRVIDVPVPADDRELARLLGPHLDLRRYSTEDGEQHTATTADGTVVVRLRGVVSSHRDLSTMRRHRTGAKTPGRAARGKRSGGAARDGR